MVLVNMLNAEEVLVTTAMGGGRAGPLRIDMQRGRAVLLASGSMSACEGGGG